jgi:DNA polymerase-3 subunit gamma/tau
MRWPPGTPALFGAVEAVIDAGHDPRRFAIDLLERFRDLIVLQAVPDAAVKGVVDAPEDMLDRMRDQSARIGPATLARYAEVVHAGLAEMRGATAPRLLLEVFCARLLLPSASDTESALLHRVERIEKRLDMSIPAGSTQPGLSSRERSSPPAGPRKQAPAPEPAARPAPKPEPQPAPQPEVAAAPAGPAPPAAPAAPVPQTPGEPDAAAVRAMWSTVRDKVRQRSRTTEVMLAGATVRAVEGNTLVLTHESGPLAKRLCEQRNTDVIVEALKDALGVDWRVRCESGAPPDIENPTPAPAHRADEEAMLAEADAERGDSSAPRRDPEEAALELLQNELGARRIGEG